MNYTSFCEGAVLYGHYTAFENREVLPLDVSCCFMMTPLCMPNRGSRFGVASDAQKLFGKILKLLFQQLTGSAWSQPSFEQPSQLQSKSCAVWSCAVASTPISIVPTHCSRFQEFAPSDVLSFDYVCLTLPLTGTGSQRSCLLHCIHTDQQQTLPIKSCKKPYTSRHKSMSSCT